MLCCIYSLKHNSCCTCTTLTFETLVVATLVLHTPYIQLYWVLENWSNAFSDNSNHLCHSHLSILLYLEREVCYVRSTWSMACCLSPFMLSSLCESQKWHFITPQTPLPLPTFANQFSSCFLDGNWLPSSPRFACGWQAWNRYTGHLKLNPSAFGAPMIYQEKE